MRILWVKSELLHPVDKGGRIRTYQMLRALSKKHSVTYLCLDDGRAAADAVTRAHEYCAELVTVPFRPADKRSPAFAFDLLRNLISPLPYAIARYRSDALRARVVDLARRVDLIVCDFLTCSQSIPEGLAPPKVLFEHNVEAAIWKLHASLPQNVIRRAFMRAQWRRMQRFEASECRRFDHVIAVSESDAASLRAEYGLREVSSVPTGVDLEYFDPPAARPTVANEIVFVGSMDWMPNDDGIRWFAENVFNRVRERIPDAVLTVVGRSPSQAMRELASRIEGIVITGTVPDVRPFLARAQVNVVPLRVGGGTRLKIYEAMAMRVPVVSTTIGAEGLPVRDGEHLLIADEPVAQASAIAGLLQDRTRATRLADAAQRFVREHCSWDVVTDTFMQQCISVHKGQEELLRKRIA